MLLKTVFINPPSLDIKGQLITYGSGGALPFRKFLDLIHRDLYLGKWGRWYSELAATWLWITALTGLIYFLRKRKTTIHNSQQKIYSVISWHKLTGIVLILPMLLLSITGLTWSEYAGDKISKIRSALSWQTPSINRSLNEDNPLQITDIDTVVKTAYANGINSSKIEIKPPSHEKETWLVSEIDRLYPNEADAVSINSKNMSVVDKLEFKNFSFMAKFTRWE